jgi:hypothetical protein
MVLYSRYQQGQSSPVDTEDRQMFIDENTSREDLLSAIYGTTGPENLIDVCIARNIDPENMDDAELLALLREWIEAGDECAKSAA